MTIYNNILTWFTKEGIEAEFKAHEATYTSEESAKIRGDELSIGAKAILYKVDEEFLLFVLSADRKMDTKKIKSYFKAKGFRVKKSRFAKPEELFEKTGLVPGSVPPFGEPILPFKLYVDHSLLNNECIAFNAGLLTHSIQMKLEDYKMVSKAELFSFTDFENERS